MYMLTVWIEEIQSGIYKHTLSVVSTILQLYLYLSEPLQHLPSPSGRGGAETQAQVHLGTLAGSEEGFGEAARVQSLVLTCLREEAVCY